MLEIVGATGKERAGVHVGGVNLCASSKATQQAFRQIAGRPACRRACGGGFRRERSARLRAVEACQGGRSGRMRESTKSGIPRLAPRMLGHGLGYSGQPFRHSRRGGADLQFPHHENEIAQARGRIRCQYVNYWMHNGLSACGQRNMQEPRQLLHHPRSAEKYDAEVVHFFILRAHYRSPLNVQPASGRCEGRIDAALHGTETAPLPPGRVGWGSTDWTTPNAIRFAMDDDFEHPKCLFDLANDANRQPVGGNGIAAKSIGRRARPAATRPARISTRGEASEGGWTTPQSMFRSKRRIAAKKARNFAEADRIRKELIEAGILEDTARARFGAGLRVTCLPRPCGQHGHSAISRLRCRQIRHWGCQLLFVYG